MNDISHDKSVAGVLFCVRESTGLNATLPLELKGSERSLSYSHRDAT